MLSIVPLMNGGGLFETGAGGSAPKHVEQFTEENYLRWDRLGEFFALAPSLRAHQRQSSASPRPRSSPTPSTPPPASSSKTTARPAASSAPSTTAARHFYLALYWAEALAAQDKDAELKAIFTPVAEQLFTHEARIVEELLAVQGKPVDIGGYYLPDDAKANAALRPSETLQRHSGSDLDRDCCFSQQCNWPRLAWRSAPRTEKNL